MKHRRPVVILEDSTGLMVLGMILLMTSIDPIWEGARVLVVLRILALLHGGSEKSNCKHCRDAVW